MLNEIICPKCGIKIDKIVQKVLEVMRIDENDSDWLSCDYDEDSIESFLCPVCNEQIASNYGDAVKLLKGKSNKIKDIGLCYVGRSSKSSIKAHIKRPDSEVTLCGSIVDDMMDLTLCKNCLKQVKI